MKFNAECKIEKIAASEKDYRPSLQNVYFDVDKKSLIATDGKHMAVVNCTPEEGDTSGYISPDAIKEYRKQSKKSFAEFVANGTQKIGPITIPRPTIADFGPYPNWPGVLPSESKPVVLSIRLDAARLLALAQALGETLNWVTLEFRGELEVIEIKGPEGVGYLMPVRK